ncbi:MAG: ATP-dependent RNA helicase RhlB [Gammaproteobacteria bacterium]|nr:ATP-dependent RNA helicase RhlB [Gammaproteobacteria bacterium]
MIDTDTEKHTQFEGLGLHPQLLQGVKTAGFVRCTPIQAGTLPLALAGQDVAGQAQTGTGKTAAFLLALMQRLMQEPALEHRKPNQPRAIVLAPTRELAIQIHKDAQVLGQYTGLKMALVYGGVDYDKQRAELQAGVEILIGTPGRIIDYFKQHVFDLRAIEVMVLDEADRMFDLGFIKDIRFLLRRMPAPERRLSMLFSATLSLRVQELAYEHMNNPRLVEVNPDKVTVDAVAQVLYHVENREKLRLLMGLLRRINPVRTLVFVNTKRAADLVADTLRSNSCEARVLSGDVPQKKRQSLLARFARGELPVLVATDVAARGLHIPGVSHVINYDLPQNGEDYVHRIGRTARAGATGDAISLACEDYVYSLMDIEEYIGHRIPTEKITEGLVVELKPIAREERTERPRSARPHRGGPSRGGGGGGRRGRARGPRAAQPAG